MLVRCGGVIDGETYLIVELVRWSTHSWGVDVPV